MMVTIHFAAEKDIIQAGCLAHARRKFWEAFKATKGAKNTFAEHGLKQIKEVYKVEVGIALGPSQIAVGAGSALFYGNLSLDQTIFDSRPSHH